MIDYYETKTHPVTKKMVLDAYKEIRNNGQACGIDEVSLSEFAQDLPGNLYKIWNRMTSGSYTPLPVREVAIPKQSGGVRNLGIPTITDRIAQQVVKKYLEPKVEPVFHMNSYGYRAKMNAHHAVDKAFIRCRFIPWVIDLDIKGFFDNIDHDLLMKAVKHCTNEKWVLLYIEKWLKAGVMSKGLFVEKRSGTPQGGVISPLLSNIFLHFAFDMWMQKYHPAIEFERYCDDIIVHCRTISQARFMKDKIAERLRQCKLELNKDKTSLVYCRHTAFREKHEVSSFDFLGFTFRPQMARTKNGDVLIFAPRMSSAAKKQVRTRIKQLPFFVTNITVQELAQKINQRTRGWMSYFCKFEQRTTRDLWYWLNTKIIRWIMKRRRFGKKHASRWLKSVYVKQPSLFLHWKLVRP